MEAAPAGIPYIQLLACSKNAPPAPMVSAIVHAADFRSRALAPGQLATLFGENLGPAEAVGAELDEQGRVNTKLGGVRVLFDGIEAPLFFVRRDQINVQVPYETAGRRTVLVKVRRDDGLESTAVVLDVAAAAPAFFLHAGEKRAIALFADGGMSSDERPAREGDVLVLFATGGGVLSPGALTGAPATAPLGRPAPPYRITIGGEEAPIDYLGAAPGYVGLLQANVRMTAARGKAPIVLHIGEAASDPAAYVVGAEL